MPPLRRCYREQNTDGRHLRDRRERLIVVDAVFLRVALGNQPGLVSVDQAVGVVFDLIHPMIEHGSLPRILLMPPTWLLHFTTDIPINQVRLLVFRLVELVVEKGG